MHDLYLETQSRIVPVHPTLSCIILLAAKLSWDTGAGWSNRAGKVAYESRRDYIIAVKGKIRLRVTLSTQSESAAFRRISLISSSGDLWCGVAMTVSMTVS